jgi:hypothetical protein
MLDLDYRDGALLMIPSGTTGAGHAEPIVSSAARRGGEPSNGDALDGVRFADYMNGIYDTRLVPENVTVSVSR